MKKSIAMRTTPIQISLSENTPEDLIPSDVQLMRTCTFYHKQYGKVDITRRLFDEMVENFEKGTRGIDVMIDYAHDSDREAAGWVKELSIKEVQLSEADEQTGVEQQIEHQLWATVEWTPKGRRTLSDKEFAYLSADFDPNYKDNENPTHSYGAVLLGAGLTNRPVIKRMSPAVQLSEFSETQDKEKTFMENENKELEEMKGKLSDSQAKLAEIDSIMQDLGVSSIEELMNKIKEMRNENVELAEEKEKAERETKLNVLLSEGKISQAQKEKALKLDGESFKGFFELAEMNEQVVKLDESGNNKTPTEESEVEDVEEKVFELAEKKMKEDDCSLSDAISFVLSENKELKKAYYANGGE